MKQYLLTFLWGCLLLCFTVSGQSYRVSGIVSTAEQGAPLDGVSVTVKNTDSGTTTNNAGYYELEVPNQKITLVFSFLGRKPLELVLTKPVNNITLEPDVIGLNEVIVTAYGTSLKQEYTGSVSTVQPSKLERFNAADFTKVLQGFSSGVYTAGRNGQPGEGEAIRIRGLNTFGDANPLIVLDGFPYDGNLNAIPLADIQSVSVLKDAPATALYGSRAANGVIIVTTKRGKGASEGVRIQASYGLVNRAVADYSKVNRRQYYELQWEALRNAMVNQGTNREEAGIRASEQLVSTLGGYNAYDVPDPELVGSNGAFNTDAHPLWSDTWREELFQTGTRREVVLAVGGESDKSTYYLSGTLLDEEGIIKASNFSRYSVRVNVSAKPVKNINAGINVSGVLSEQNYPESDNSSLMNPFRSSEFIAPVYPVYLYDNKGVLQRNDGGEKNYDFGEAYGRTRPYAPKLNVLGTLVHDTRLYKNDQLNLRSFADIKIGGGLSFRSSISADYNGFNALTHTNMLYGTGIDINGFSERLTERLFSYSANQMLLFNKNIQNHSLKILAAHENYSYQSNVLSASRSGFKFPGQVELDAAAVAEGSGSYQDKLRLESYFGKVDYSWKRKYFFSFNLRADGNSRFATAGRWGNFWGAGAAWLLSEEALSEDVRWLSSLKLKLSYGEQGNDKIGSFYGYQGLYRTDMNNLNLPGSLADRIATPELTWESLNSFNAGVEMIINERYGFNLDFYVRQNNDLLFNKPLPPSTGFLSVDANIARLSNKGVDFEMTGSLIDLDKMKWVMDINLSHFKNKIKELPQEFIISGNKRWETGRSIYDFYIEEYAGVDPGTGKSQWYYDIPARDENDQPIVDESGNVVYEAERGITTNHSAAGRYYTGSAIPKLFGGINNQLSYLNFDLSFLFTFSAGGKVFDHNYQMLMHSGLPGTHWHSDILQRWSPEKNDGPVPVLDGDQFANQRSTRFLADASYMSLQNVVLRYSVPQVLTSRIGTNEVFISIKADNLFLISARQGMVPYQSFDGYVQPQYLPVRTVSLGFDIQL